MLEVHDFREPDLGHYFEYFELWRLTTMIYLSHQSPYYTALDLTTKISSNNCLLRPWIDYVGLEYYLYYLLIFYLFPSYT